MTGSSRIASYAFHAARAASVSGGSLAHSGVTEAVGSQTRKMPSAAIRRRARGIDGRLPMAQVAIRRPARRSVRAQHELGLVLQQDVRDVHVALAPRRRVAGELDGVADFDDVARYACARSRSVGFWPSSSHGSATPSKRCVLISRRT